MAVIDAARERAHAEQSGIRPFDIGRDLRPVAELIADAFSDELDPSGKAALREMRIMSHVSGLLKLVNRSTGEFDDVFNGFVWQEDGRIVGNVTVQRADRYGTRWQIANVAVAPEYRGRGIARRLMAEALDRIESSRGHWAVLQVYDHNDVARDLYLNCGFEDVGGTAELQLKALPNVEAPEAIPGFGSFSASQWPPLYELASAQLNTQTQWWRAVRRSDFQISLDQQGAEWIWKRLGRTHVFRRCIRTTRRFEAAVILTAQRWRGEHKLAIWVRPEHYGRYEADLAQWALATLQDFPRYPLTATLSTEHTGGIDMLQGLGFRRSQTLVTMRRRVFE